MPTTSPVFPSKRSGLETARERWSRRSAISLRNNIPMDVVRQAYLYDLDRINKGGQPMSDRQAAIAIASHDRLPGESGVGSEAGGPVLGPVLGFAENAARDLVGAHRWCSRCAFDPRFFHGRDDWWRPQGREVGCGPCGTPGVYSLGSVADRFQGWVD